MPSWPRSCGAYAGGAHPKSLKVAYRKLRDTPGWRAWMGKPTRYQQTIERVLDRSAGGVKIGDGPVEQLKRGHVKAILNNFRRYAAHGADRH